jgi:hypothetical protein
MCSYVINPFKCWNNHFGYYDLLRINKVLNNMKNWNVFVWTSICFQFFNVPKVAKIVKNEYVIWWFEPFFLEKNWLIFLKNSRNWQFYNFFIVNVAIQNICILIVIRLKRFHIAFESMLHNAMKNYSNECSNFKFLF